MKRKIFPFAATLLLLSGCNTDVTSDISAELTSSDVTEEVSTVSPSAEQTEKTVVTENTGNSEISVPLEVPESAKYTVFPAPSDGNVFVDYCYIDEPASLAEAELEADVLSRAVEVLAQTEDYTQNCNSFLGASEGFLTDSEAENLTNPEFYMAFRDDFDGNGSTEYFLLISAPYDYYSDKNTSDPVYYLLFVPSEGKAQYLTCYRDNVTGVRVLDYGMCRHIVFEDNGTMGAWCHTELFGVNGNKAVEHYCLRGSFEKTECFVYAMGWQGSGGFMYYDTVAKEYRNIIGEDIPLKTIQEMDSTGILEQYRDKNGGYDDFEAVLMCDKFYMLGNSIMMNAYGEPYLYENGEFIKSEGIFIRRSHAGTNGLNCVIKVDYETAAGSMLSPEQAADCT